MQRTWRKAGAGAGKVKIGERSPQAIIEQIRRKPCVSEGDRTLIWNAQQESVEVCRQGRLRLPVAKDSLAIAMCVDEGAALPLTNRPFCPIRNPGCGISYLGLRATILERIGTVEIGADDFLVSDEYLRFVDHVKALGAIAVSSHEDCGADREFRNQYPGVQIKPDSAARAAAELLAFYLQIEAEPIHIGQYTPVTLRRPIGFHPARVLAIDFFGCNLGQLGIIALHMDARVEPTEATLWCHAGLCLRILMDPVHAFGDRWSVDEPLIVLIIGEKSETRREGRKLREIIRPYGKIVEIVHLDPSG